MDKIDIVLVTYNRIKFTQSAIEAIHKRTTTSHRLIVVDNNSNDGTIDLLREYKAKGIIYHLILLGRNYGIHMAKNYGLNLVRSEPYYIDTDNDLLCAKLEPDWIQQLITLMDKYPEYGAIACRPQVLVGRSGDEFDKANDVLETNHNGAHLRIMRTRAVKDVGGWEKTWDANRNHEDSYIASKLHGIQLKVGYASNVRCWHLFGENWGYYNIPKEQHGHREIWPPPEHYDKEFNNFDHDTWQPK